MKRLSYFGHDLLYMEKKGNAALWKCNEKIMISPNTSLINTPFFVGLFTLPLLL